MKKLLLAIFIVSLSVTGCENPYIGSTLTVDNVDRYRHSVGEDTACLQDGFDFICVKVIPGAGGPQGPKENREALVRMPLLSTFMKGASFMSSIMKTGSFCGQKRRWIPPNL